MATDHAQTRTTIVEAAREVFSRYGYKKTKLDDIASSLHRAKSSIYYYFKNKEDVFRAVVEYEADRAKRYIHEAVDSETTPEAKLGAYCKAIMRFYKETVNYYNLMQEEIIDVMSFATEEKQKHDRESAAFFTTILNQGIADGTFEITDVDATVRAIRFALNGLFFPCNRQEELNEKELDILLNILFNGIKRHPC